MFRNELDLRAVRCISCDATAHISGLSIRHRKCPVTMWLAENYQFEIEGDITYTSNYAHVKLAVTRIATALANAQKNIGALPYIVADDKELVAYIIG